MKAKSGRTSSISHQIIGFDAKGKIVNTNNILGKLSWPEITKSSSKVISLFDLAGHEKYLKTTITGMASSSPNICMVVVGANRGILRMTKEHIFLCLALKIPFIIVITKMDMVVNNQKILDETLSSIHKIIKHPQIRRIPVKIKSNEDVITSAKQIYTESIVPIFSISNVTGEGIENIQSFLNLLPNKNTSYEKNDVEYRIDSSWSITGVGTVVGGHLTSGKIGVGDKLLIGPINKQYETVIIRSYSFEKGSNTIC